MKKIFKTLLLILLIIFSLYVVKAATEDTTPPVLKGVSIVNNKVSAGDKLYLNIDAFDDVSGIDEEHVSIGLYSYKKGYVDNQYDVVYSDDESYVILDDDMLDGKYLLAFVWLSDNKGNNTVYYNEKIIKVNPEKFSIDDGDVYLKFNTPDVEVSSNLKENDTLPPVLESIEIDKEEANVNESVKVKIKANDESEIKNIFVDFYRKDDKTGYIPTNDLIRIDDDNFVDFIYDEKEKVYVVQFTFKKTGEYILSHLQIDDNYLNSSYYGNYESKEDYRFLLDKEYKVKVNGTDEIQNDNDLPSLNGIKLNKKSIIAPGNINIYVETDDLGSGVSHCSAFFISDTKYKESKKKNQYADPEVYAFMSYDESVKKCVGIINVDQYTKSDTYHIGVLQITDKSGNTVAYHSPVIDENTTYGSNRRDMEDITFEVKKEFPSDLITSTINPDIVNQIKKEKDDSVIMIDATKNTLVKKEIFEAIQNTNKTIYIEFDGYQWVFNGKDITNPKDIDVTIKTESLSNNDVDNSNDDYISIIFADNGELPGKAKIRVKLDYTHKYIEGFNDLMLLFLDEEKEENPFKVEVNKVDLADDGFYEFEITHNSTYVLTNKEIVYKEKSNVINKTIDLSNPIIIATIAIICIIIVVITVCLIKKKKTKE